MGSQGVWAARAGVRACPCRLPTEQYLPDEPEPFLAAYLHSEPRPNEYNCSASKKISLEALAGGDHRPYTFFIAPGCGAQRPRRVGSPWWERRGGAGWGGAWP